MPRRKRERLLNPAPIPSSRTIVALSLIAAGALAFRLVDLGTHSLWFDEALEYGRAAGSLALALFGRPVDQDPPLLALFNHAWLRAGASEWWLRLPSALLGAATVFVAGGWLLRRFGNRMGILAAALFAVAPLQVHYSQELNQYAAVLFLSVVILIAWEAVARRGRSTDWAVYATVSALGLGTHYGMVFPLAALNAYLLWRIARSDDRGQRRLLAAYVALGAVVVVVLLWLGLAQRLTQWHLQRRFGGTYPGKELAYIGDMAWREVLVFFLLPFSGGPSLWAVRILTVVAIAGAIALWRHGDTGRRIVGVAFFGALAAVYPADGLGLYPMGNRYVLFAVAPFFAALAAGFDWAIGRSRVIGWAAVAATLALFVAFAPQQVWGIPWLSVPREELRPVLAQLKTLRRDTEATYVYFGAGPAFDFYARQTEPGAIRGQHLGSQVTPASEASRIVQLAGDKPVWLVLSHERPGDRAALLDALALRGLIPTRTIEERNASAIRVARVATTGG